MEQGDFNTAKELLETTRNFDIVKIKAGLDIKMYKVVHTGPKTHDGGLKDG